MGVALGRVGGGLAQAQGFRSRVRTLESHKRGSWAGTEPARGGAETTDRLGRWEHCGL